MGHDLMSMEPRYILKNLSNVNIIENWTPPYYIQAAFGLTNSHDSQCKVAISPQFTSSIYMSAQKQEHRVVVFVCALKKGYTKLQ